MISEIIVIESLKILITRESPYTQIKNFLLRYEKINTLNQFHQSDTTAIPLFVWTKKGKSIVLFGHSEGFWGLRRH